MKLLDKEWKKVMHNLNYKELTDENLLSLAKTQDETAIEELLSRYKYIVTTVTRSYFLNGGDTEDLVQEGMIALFNAINTYNNLASFKSYVYTCVKNRIITVIKQSNRFKNQPLNNYISLSGIFNESADKNEMIIAGGFGPEETVINSENENELKNIIKETLSSLESRVLSYYLKGYSYKELSEYFNKSEKSIDNALQRARKKILLKLEK